MSYELVQVKVCARQLAQMYPDQIESYKVDVFFPDPWTHYIRKLQTEKMGPFFKHKDYLIVYLNDDIYIGGADNFLEWALQKFKYVDKTNQLLYKKQATNEIRKMYNSTKGRSVVYLSIKIGDNPESHQVLIELFEDLCPKTCHNFKELCIGFSRPDAPNKKLHYQGSEFDRVVPGCFIQGGNLRKNKRKLF